METERKSRGALRHPGGGAEETRRYRAARSAANIIDRAINHWLRMLTLLDSLPISKSATPQCTSHDTSSWDIHQLYKETEQPSNEGVQGSFRNPFILIVHCIKYKFCICICFDGVVIAAQCTATFSELLCSPEFRYY